MAPTQEEEDLWDQSLLNVSTLYLWPLLGNHFVTMGDVTNNSLQCYEQLTKWPELEQTVIVNVDDNDPPSLDKIWEDGYRQVSNVPTPGAILYLPWGYFISHCPGATFVTITGALLAIHPPC